MRIAVFVINLDRDKDRLAFMARQLDALGLAWERFPAVLGLAVPDELRAWFFTPEGAPSPTLTPGEIGVYASHLSAHHRLLASDFDAALVFEDDVEISARLPAFLAQVDALPQGFDLVRLSNPSKSAYVAWADLGAAGELVAYARVPNNLGCYLISRAGAAKTTAPRGLRVWAIDEDMRRPWDWGLATYGVLPPPTKANVLDASSIDALSLRALGRESAWDKLRRRRWISPLAAARRIRWQIAFLGSAPWLRCLARDMLKSFMPKRSRASILRVRR